MMDHLMTGWLGWVAVAGGLWVAMRTTFGLMERPAVRDRLTGAQRGREVKHIGSYRRGVATIDLGVFEAEFQGQPVLLLRKETRMFGSRRASYIRLSAEHAQRLCEALQSPPARPPG